MNNNQYSDHNPGVKGFQVHRNSPELRGEIRTLLERFYINLERTEDVLDEKLINRRKDVVLADMDQRLDVPNCHDEDLNIFRAFNNPDDLIVDIGANWGYSVADIWAYGAKCKILSFEPVKFYAPLFDRIKELRPGRYEYKIVALFDEPSALKFSVPVINNLPVFALSSATENPDLDIMVNNACYHIDNYMRDDLIINVRMHEFESPVDTLDNQLASISKTFSWSTIAALKIDVEGLEFPVIRGAKNTINTHRPLIMLEGGNRWPGLTEYMASLGYDFAEREGDQMVLFSGTGTNINGFFVPRDKFSEYRGLGILK